MNSRHFVLAVAAFFVQVPIRGQSIPTQAPEVRSQSAGSAALHGTVLDAEHRPVAGATITLQGKESRALTVRTDSAGSYHFFGVRRGAYTLHAVMQGYRDGAVRDFVVREKESKEMDITLDSAKGSGLDSSSGKPEFFDDPHFTVAGVTDTTSLGGHGSDTVVRNREALAKETVALRKPSREDRPDSIAAQHHQLADLNEKQGKPLNAVREYQRAAELNPSEGNLFDWGAELLLHHAPEPAIEVFSKGNRLFPQSVRMLTALGVAWYAQGSYERATQRLCEASDIDPRDPEPYLAMGKIDAAESSRSQAMAERLERFAKLQPENALANYYFAVSLWKEWRSSEDAAQLARVQTLIEKAISIDPKLSIAYLQLGIFYSDQKDLPNAILAYRQAIAADSQLEEAHYRLAQVYRQTGKTADAQTELRIYEEISKEKKEKIDRQRHEVQQFVYELRDPSSTAQQK